MTHNPATKVIPRSGNRYIEAVDAQLDLMAFWRSDQGMRYADAYVRYSHEQREQGLSGILEYPVNSDQAQEGITEGWSLALREYYGLRLASTYWVSGDLGEIIARAAKVLPDEPLRVTDLPTPAGFLFLDKPMYVLDMHGQKVGIKIIRWTADTVSYETPKGTYSARALHVSWYGDKYDRDDESLQGKGLTEAQFNSMPRWGLWHQDVWFWAAMPDEQRQAILDEGAEAGAHKPGEAQDGYNLVLQATEVSIPMSSAWNTPRVPSGVTSLLPSPEEDLWLWIHGDDGVADWMNAFFRIVNQDIVRVSRGSLPRAVRRRLERADHPEWEDVRVIDLRRTVYIDGRETEPDDEAWKRWTHQWRVNPHWRRQWYGSTKDGTRHWKWILVPGHLKGPEYLPLVIRDDVRRVVR